jgi:predicted  nucleic acid-binding Zn-ribbon protein
MAGPATILREIHRLRTHARDLQDSIDRAPRQFKAQQNAVAREEANLHDAHDAIKKLKVTIHEKELSVKSTHEHTKKYEQQLNDITSKKEYDALKLEIAGAQERMNKLQDEALTLMLEVEERTAQLPALEEALKKTRADFAGFERDYQSRLDDWSRQREEVLKQIVAAEEGLPKDIRTQYDRLVKQLGADALAAVVDRTCTACYTEITAQAFNNLKVGQIVFCKSCARLLYWKEEG